MCAGPKTNMYTPFLEEAYSYKYEEIPNYGKLRFILESLIMQRGFLPDKKIQWAYYVDEELSDQKHSSISSQDIPDEEKDFINNFDKDN